MEHPTAAERSPIDSPPIDPLPVAPAPGAAADHAVGHGYITDKEKYLARLKRIEGQARGIHRMVDQEQYCIDILTQVSAMTKALHAVSIGLLEDHMNHCVVDAARVGDAEAREKVAEATEAIARLVRS